MSWCNHKSHPTKPAPIKSLPPAAFASASAPASQPPLAGPWWAVLVSKAKTTHSIARKTKWSPIREAQKEPGNAKAAGKALLSLWLSLFTFSLLTFLPHKDGIQHSWQRNVKICDRSRAEQRRPVAEEEELGKHQEVYQVTELLCFLLATLGMLSVVFFFVRFFVEREKVERCGWWHDTLLHFRLSERRRLKAGNWK